MSIKQVVHAATSLDKRVASTMVDAAIAFGTVVWDTFGGGEITDDDMSAMLDGIEAESPWKGSSSAGARRSEWKAAINAVPFYFVEACRFFKREYPVGFNRVAMFKLARLLPNIDDFKAAVHKVVKDASAKKIAGTAAPRSLAAVVKSIFAIQTRKRNEIAFRKELAALCVKHGVDYA